MSFAKGDQIEQLFKSSKRIIAITGKRPDHLFRTMVCQLQMFYKCEQFVISHSSIIDWETGFCCLIMVLLWGAQCVFTSLPKFSVNWYFVVCFYFNDAKFSFFIVLHYSVFVVMFNF